MNTKSVKINKRLFVLIVGLLLIFTATITMITYAVLSGRLSDSHTESNPFISVDLTNGTTSITSITGSFGASGAVTLKYGNTTMPTPSSATVNLKNSGNINILFDAIYVTVEFFNSQSDLENNNAIGISNTNAVGGGYYITVNAASNFDISDNMILTPKTSVVVGKSGSASPADTMAIISGFTFSGIDANSNLYSKYFKISLMVCTHQENMPS